MSVGLSVGVWHVTLYEKLYMLTADCISLRLDAAAVVISCLGLHWVNDVPVSLCSLDTIPALMLRHLRAKFAGWSMLLHVARALVVTWELVAALPCRPDHHPSAKSVTGPSTGLCCCKA